MGGEAWGGVASSLPSAQAVPGSAILQLLPQGRKSFVRCVN